MKQLLLDLKNRQFKNRHVHCRCIVTGATEADVGIKRLNVST